MSGAKSAIRAAATRVFGRELADADSLALIRGHAKSYAATLRRLDELEELSARKQRARIDGFVKAFSSRYCAVVLAANSVGAKLSLADAEAIAAEISVYRDCLEPVGLACINKADGGVRHAVNPGLRRRALNILAGQVVRSLHPNADHQFLCKGRGASRAVERVLQFINQENLPWVLSFDIVNCFASMRREGFSEILGLPQSLVEHSIFVEGSTPIAGTTTSHSAIQALLRGLPQGMPASNIVAAAAFKCVFANLQAARTGVIYGDNFIVCCSSREEAVALYEALRLRLEGHLAGALELHKVSIRHISQGTRVLGYDLLPGSPQCGARATPNVHSLLKAVERLEERLAKAPDWRLDTVAIEWAAKIHASYPAWTPVIPATETAFSGLETYALDLSYREYQRRSATAQGETPPPSAAKDPFFVELPSTLL